MSRRSKRSREAPMSFFSFQDIISCTTGILVLVTLLLTIELATRTYAKTPELQSEAELQQRLTAARVRQQELTRQVQSAAALAESNVTTPISPAQVTAAQHELERRRLTVQAAREKLRRLDQTIAELSEHLIQEATLADSLAAAIARFRMQIEEALRDSRVVLIGGPATNKVPILVELSAERIVVGMGRTPAEREVLATFAGGTAVDQFLTWAESRLPGSEYFVLFTRASAASDFDRVLEVLRGRLGFDVGWDAWPEDRFLFEQEP
jgi:predicted Holliday junction resolvase-like endonuclease